MWRKMISSLCLGLGWVLLGCAAQEQAPANPVVAKVGDEPIYKKDVEELIASLGPGLRSKESGDAARRDYLQSLIDQKLLVRAARARGLDKTQRFDEQLAARFREKVINTYQARTVYARIEITDEKMRQRFDQGQYQREKSLSRLVVDSLEDAREIRRQIAQGAALDSLAKAYSRDGRTPPRGGHLGFLNRVSAVQAGIAPQVFVALSPGAVSEVMLVDGGFELIYCADEREAEFAKYREELYRSMWREEFVAQHRALLEEQASVLDLRPVSAGLAVLVDKDAKAGTYPPLSAAEASTPLFAYNGGQITVGDYIDSFRQAEEQPALGDSVQVIRAAWKLPIPKAMVWEAAKSAGYLDSEDMRLWKQRKAEQLLIMALRQVEISDQVVIEDEAIAQYYEDHREHFRTPMEIYIEEILVDDFDRAKELRQRLDQGETIADLSHLSARYGASANKGKVHIHSYEKSLYGEQLMSAAMEAELGELVGPVAVKGGYSIFRVNERTGGLMRSLEYEHERIRAILRLIEVERRFNQLVAQLREEYADQVQIFAEKLPQIELPAETPSV